MSAPDHGFALMKLPQALANAYETSPLVAEYRSDMEQLRKSFPQVRPSRYRGFGRNPINTDYDHVEPGWQWANDGRTIGEERARLALAKALGVTGDDLPNEEWLIDGPWLVPSLACAAKILNEIKQPSLYEIIETARFPSRTAAVSIGFDVGYWASGNFSILCDTAIWPVWHPPPPDVPAEVIASLSCLNEVALFPDPKSAALFRDVYRVQPWAEEEGTSFDVVEIAPVEPS